MADRSNKSRLRAWLELLRAPNLLTAPGDPLAGFLLACAGAWGGAPTDWPSRPVLRAAMAGAVSLLLYTAGLLWNDWFDLRDDLRERPSRPLPSGRVRPGTVAAVANGCMLLAVVVAAVAGRPMLYAAVALGAAVLLYDSFLKRLRVVGPLAMGLCRGLSVLVGAAAVGWDGPAQPVVLAAAGGMMLYVAAVTNLARGETQRQRVRPKAMLVFAATGAYLLALSLSAGWSMHSWRGWMTAAGIAALLWVAGCLWRMGHQPEPPEVQWAVGALLRVLILLQATACLLAGAVGAYVAAGLAAAFVASTVLGRRFHGS